MPEKKKPSRRCVCCGRIRDKRELVRIARTPEGELMVDRTGKAAGRGAYICPDGSCLELAMKSHGLERSFKQKIDKEAYEKLAEELRKQ